MHLSEICATLHVFMYFQPPGTAAVYHAPPVCVCTGPGCGPVLAATSTVADLQQWLMTVMCSMPVWLYPVVKGCQSVLLSFLQPPGF
jgi:hypothetical protein